MLYLIYVVILFLLDIGSHDLMFPTQMTLFLENWMYIVPQTLEIIVPLKPMLSKYQIKYILVVCPVLPICSKKVPLWQQCGSTTRILYIS